MLHWGNKRLSSILMLKQTLNEYFHYREEGSIRGSGFDSKAVTDADEHSQRYKIVEIIMHPLMNEQ